MVKYDNRISRRQVLVIAILLGAAVLYLLGRNNYARLCLARRRADDVCS
jgi:hypothetical protein